MQPEPAPMQLTPQPWPLRGPHGRRQSSVRPILRTVFGMMQRSGRQQGSQQSPQPPQLPPYCPPAGWYSAHASYPAGRMTEAERGLHPHGA